MSKDYKNSGKSRKPKRKPIPGWLWMLTGLSVGLLVALLVYLTQQSPAVTAPRVEPLKPTTESAKKSEKSPADTKKPNAPAKTPLRFEFYTLLPESEVVIPEQELSERTTREGKPKPTPPGTYVLQAGSFRSQDEAKTLKGELALLGIVAEIQSVTINGDTWHRVRIGPFGTFEEINRVRDRLRGNNIMAIPVRLKS